MAALAELIPWKLVFWVAVAAGLFLGGAYLVDRHDDKIRKSRDNEWRPQLEQQTAATLMAVDAANKNKQTIDVLVNQGQQCSASVDKYADLAARATRAADAVLQARAASDASLRQSRDQHLQASTTPDPKGATCEQKLQAMGNAYRDFGSRRLRDHPPNDSSGDGTSPAAATGQGAGSGSVRITVPN